MARKRALVVDDSHSARMALRKQLERHGIEVTTAESAEAALEHLLHDHPDIIFMDHMMPGMDGFEAVRVIKSDPRTATIPVMMYTSRGGEVYVGQARALGAVGVLPKEVRPADLRQVLENLRLLPSTHTPEASPPPRPAPAAAPELSRPDIDRLAREAVDEALQRSLRAELEELRQRLRQDLREEVRAQLEQAPAPIPEPAPPRRGRWLAAALIVLAVAPLAYWLGRSSAPLATPALPGETVQPTALSEQDAQLARTLALHRVRLGGERAQLLDTLEWALNEAGRYDYGQIPFGEERLALLSELLNRLAAVGFTGTVRMEAHQGQFCLVRDAQGELRPAPADLPAGRCDDIGMPREQALAATGRQSLAFANFLSSSPILRDGKIRVELVARGDESPRFEYPQTLSGVDAGQWNAIARRNNRVEISLIPTPRS